MRSGGFATRLPALPASLSLILACLLSVGLFLWVWQSGRNEQTPHAFMQFWVILSISQILSSIQWSGVRPNGFLRASVDQLILQSNWTCSGRLCCCLSESRTLNRLRSNCEDHVHEESMPPIPVHWQRKNSQILM